MTALITGASSGIGREMARKLSNMGYDLILIARREDRLIALKNELKTQVTTVSLDISNEENCYKLFDMFKDKDIDIFINNAGFGIYGYLTDTDISRDVELIDLNIKSMHILFKLFLKKFVDKNKGYILNVASSAGFMPGPLMATYYASKAYVLNLTRAVSKELKVKQSNVKVSVLCPGPVDTEFNDVANVHFGVKPATAQYVADYTIKKMLNGKTTIIPTARMKTLICLSKITPNSMVMNITFRTQKAKNK